MKRPSRSCMMRDMALFIAKVELRFQATILESAGQELRRLQEAAEAQGSA